MVPWRDEAIKYGYKSSASFPLKVFDKVVGSFNIYSNEFNSFHEEDIKLLDEMAKDISFALEFIETETRQKQVEETLKKNEERLQLEVARMPIGYIVWDTDFRVVSWNPAAEKIFGFTFDEVKGRHPYETIVPPEAQPQVDDIWSRLLTGDTSAHSINENITRDGHTIFCEWTNTPLKQPDSTVLGVISMVQNITERILAEKEHLAHLRFFESIDQVNMAIQGARDVDSLMSDVLGMVLSIFDCDRSWLFYPCDPDASSFRVPMEVTKPEYPGAKVLNVDIPMPPDMARNLREALESADPVTYTVGTEKIVNKMSAKQFGVKSMMMVAIHPKLGKPWAFGLHQCSSPRVWTMEEKRLFQEIGRRLSDSFTSSLILQDLKKSEEKYRTLIQKIQAAVVVHGADTQILTSNSMAQELLGLTENQLLGITAIDPTWHFFREDGTVMPIEEYPVSRVLTSHQVLKNFIVGVHRPGKRQENDVWTLVNAVPIFGKEDEIVEVIVTFIDITERKRMEETLYEQQQVFRTLVENSPDIIARYDHDCKRTYVNPVYLKAAEIPQQELLNVTPTQISPLPAASAEALQNLLREVIDNGVAGVIDVIWPRKDNIDHWYNIYASPEFDRDGKVVSVITISRDITSRKQVEKEILQLNMELEQRVAERTSQLETINKELEAFAYSVSHDLRAPLSGIDGFSQALIDDYKDKLDEQGINYLNRVRSAAQRMALLIDDMLSLSRVSRNEMSIQQVNLSEMFREIAEDLHETQPERKVRFVIQKGIIVQGDSRMLRIVLENLTGNAWKFTSKHPEARIEFGMKLQNETPVYFISDDGAGFDMNYADKLFGAFQRLHSEKEFPGTGIGLATVQRIIHRHGGKVWAKGEVEKGATFNFTI